MKELMAPDFAHEEYVVRYARIQKILKRQGIDALFLSGRQNLRYFAQSARWRLGCTALLFLTLLPVEGEPVLMVSNGFQHRRFYQLAREGMFAAIEVMKPGVPCNEDVVLITENGTEILTAEELITHDLWIA